MPSRGIRTSALICPVIPYITDVRLLIDLQAEPADKIWIYGLSILDQSNQSWQNVKRILDNNFPDLKKQIATVVFSKDHSYWKILRKGLVQMQSDRNLNLSIHV